VTTLSNAARNAGSKTYTDLLDAGSGPGKIRIYDGAKPAGPDTAVTTQVLLAEFILNDPAFVAGVTGERLLDLTPVLTAEGLAVGTPTWYRALDSANVAAFDGTASGPSGSGELEVSVDEIQVGLDLEVTSGSLTQPA
jgi:hypothetical protein